MTFLTAELGTNWRGDPEVLKRMVTKCHWAGVDAVKFQALSIELINRHPEWDWYHHASITVDNIDTIDKICKEIGMEWFCTPCYPEAVVWLDMYVKRWKIRHADNTKSSILEKCIATKKEIIVSVSRENAVIGQSPYVKQVYCIPKYPTTLGELNFDMLKILKGYSNHCLDVTALYMAYRYNLDYLEFHLTDSSDSFAIDNKVSLTYPQMEEFCKWRDFYDDFDGAAIAAYNDNKIPFSI